MHTRTVNRVYVQWYDCAHRARSTAQRFKLFSTNVFLDFICFCYIFVPVPGWEYLLDERSRWISARYHANESFLATWSFLLASE